MIVIRVEDGRDSTTRRRLKDMVNRSAGVEPMDVGNKIKLKMGQHHLDSLLWCRLFGATVVYGINPNDFSFDNN